jgi:oxygen-independent coproporphyrinogen-3 oxidase
VAYWQNRPHLGIGPSAAGYINGRRYRNIADVDRYIHLIDTVGHAEIEAEELTGIALAGEMIMLGLRMLEGLDPVVVQRRTGVDISQACAGTLRELADRQLVEAKGNRIALTRAGLLVADGIIADLLLALDQHRPGGQR